MALVLGGARSASWPSTSVASRTPGSTSCSTRTGPRRDPAKKQEYAEEVNRIFAEECYNLWGTWDIWGIAHKPTVHGVENFELPDGKTSQFGQGIAGTFYPMTLWTEQ